MKSKLATSAFSALTLLGTATHAAPVIAPITAPATAPKIASTLIPAIPYADAKGQSGPATATQTATSFSLKNQLVQISWEIKDQKLQLEKVNFAGKDYPQNSQPLFQLAIESDGAPSIPGGDIPTNFSANDFKLISPPKIEKIAANAKLAKASERYYAGQRITATFLHEASQTYVQWTAELRDNSHYVRQNLNITGSKGKLRGIKALQFTAPNIKQIGTAAAGNPLANDELFLGVELPMAKNQINGNDVASGFACDLPLVKGTNYNISSVIGTYPEGQLRRAFLRYLERERAMPYQPFLHYNGWFDFDRSVNEKGMMETIADYKTEWYEKRKMPIKAFVVDDGWDDWDAGFWATNKKKFPNGFTPLGTELKTFQSHFGIWISPLGGYDHSDTRIAHAAKDGLTRDGAKSLDLSYEPYYNWFLKKCSDLIKDDKVTYFKFDKAGNGVNPHFLALLRICRELRVVDPNLVINITVGTWPSPFWLNHIDCTWRDGNDMGWEGKGSSRERWITYRDAQTWRGVVNLGPLYPLNSIMNHGIVLSDGHFFARDTLNGKGDMPKGGTDMRNEARSFFGSGTLMQEFYVKPKATPAESWDQLAEAARWAQNNADILVDTHWVGGNPSNAASVYGWAAWAPRKAILTLRNPKETEESFEFDPKSTFELPATAKGKFTVKSAYADTPSPITSASAGTPITIKLKPFQVLVLEFSPTN